MKNAHIFKQQYRVTLCIFVRNRTMILVDTFFGAIMYFFGHNFMECIDVTNIDTPLIFSGEDFKIWVTVQ